MESALPVLNLPLYSFEIKSEGNKDFIFDTFRRKYVSLTPEEWVRQNFMQFLVKEKAFPPGLVAPEISLNSNGLRLRCDVLVYNRQGKPCLIVECKAPDILISQSVFNQIWQYNMKLNLGFLIVTNGLSHYCCKINAARTGFDFLNAIPSFEELGL